jgi:2,6-dihydroxypyridine 3-monooxygenase
VQGEGRRAAVIGGSLGGLTAANLLRDHGWDVVVYEKSGVPLDGRGAGIVVHASTVRYLLDRMGLDLDTISCPSTVLRYFDPDGSIIHEEPSTYRFTAWNTLYRNLLEGIGDRHMLGHALCGLDIGGDRAHSGDGPDDRVDRPVELRFANGVVEHAELVVAADGFDSTVRRRLFGPVDATYSGYVGWRGMVVESDLTSNTFDQLADAISYSVIPSSHIVAYPIPTVDGSVRLGERLVNYVWYRNVAAGADLEELMTGTDGNLRMASLHPGAVQARFIAEMKHAAEQLAPVMTEVVQRTPEPFLQVIQDIETPKMATARVALLGDGAFSARPHAAAGTAKAAEDGWKLIEALETHDTIPEALRHWERGQLELGRQLVARTRDLGERSQFRNTWTPGDPELAFGLFGPGH